MEKESDKNKERNTWKIFLMMKQNTGGEKKNAELSASSEGYAGR